MICGDIWELFAIELYFIGEISTISNEFKLFSCQTESNSNIGPLFWVLRARLSTPIFLSNIFPLKMSKETYFHKKTHQFLFFPKQQKMYKNYGLCMTKADNFFGYLFARYIPDFPNSQISSNPPNCYQQCLVQMIY